MLKVKSVTIENHSGYLGKNVFTVAVTFQVGDRSYNEVTVDLPGDTVREIVGLAVTRATDAMTTNIPIIEVANDPDFAEVEPAPELVKAAGHDVVAAEEAF